MFVKRSPIRTEYLIAYEEGNPHGEYRLYSHVQYSDGVTIDSTLGYFSDKLTAEFSRDRLKQIDRTTKYKGKFK